MKVRKSLERVGAALIKFLVTFLQLVFTQTMGRSGPQGTIIRTSTPMLAVSGNIVEMVMATGQLSPGP